MSTTLPNDCVLMRTVTKLRFPDDFVGIQVVSSMFCIVPASYMVVPSNTCFVLTV